MGPLIPPIFWRIFAGHLCKAIVNCFYPGNIPLIAGLQKIFSDVIDYVKNNLNIHRKIITTAERDMRLTDKFIRENIDETENAGYYFPVRYKIPLMDQGNFVLLNFVRI